MSKLKRIYGLDYLRGSIAIGIMCYHFMLFTGAKLNADTFLGRIGIYGVTIFYILSGLTLYHVYFQKFTFKLAAIQSFFKKRMLRIYPLLWLVTLYSVCIYGKEVSASVLALNLSGLFGFMAWDQYLATGAWSIGNELVFYVLFPLVVYLAKFHLKVFYVFGILFFMVYLYFAFFYLDSSKTLAMQWKNYIHPINQGFAFLLGFWMGYLFEKITISKIILNLLALLSVLVFIFLPMSGNQIVLVTQFGRIIFTILCFIICLNVYKNEILLPKFLHIPLVFLGEISYGIYLLHPIVYFHVSKYFRTGFILDLNTYQKLAIPFVLTIVISYLVYRYYELFFVSLGRSPKKKEV